MVVIKSPNTMAACGLKHILHLHFSHQIDILIEDQANQLFQLGVGTESKAIERPAKIHEGHLVPSSVINSYV